VFIKLDLDLQEHPRTILLQKLLNTDDAQTIGLLANFWMWCMRYAEDGDLNGYDADQIARAARWIGDPALFSRSMREAGWIEDDNSVHAWAQHGGKLKKAQEKANKRWREWKQTKGKRTANAPQTHSKRDANAPQTHSKRDANAPQTLREGEGRGERGERDILSLTRECRPGGLTLVSLVSLFTEICTSLPKAQATDTRKKAFAPHLRKYPDQDYWTRVFTKAEASDFLSGRNGKWTNCCLDWFKSEANRQKVLEGNYDNDRAQAAQVTNWGEE